MHKEMKGRDGPTLDEGVGRFLGLEALLPWTCGFHMQCIRVDGSDSFFIIRVAGLHQSGMNLSVALRNTMQWLPFDLDKAPTIHPMEDVIERGHKKGISLPLLDLSSI